MTQTSFSSYRLAAPRDAGLRRGALLLVASIAAAGVISTGCDNKPTKDKPVATVAEPTAASAAPLAPAGTAVTYRVTPPDSKVEFVGAKITGKHEGSFKTFDGAIRLVDGDPTKSTVSVDIEMASVVTDQEKLTGHLKSADFFEVEKHPKARFVSTEIRAGGEKGASHTVTGNLDLHGVTKAITFPATIRTEGDKVLVDAEFGINRKDFGIVYKGKPDDLIRDDVLIKLTLRAAKAAS